ncbi:MAG: cytochrome b562 [Oleiphilaceae bacterium]|nr:cytochrome b562 [Oleiphilaceae bacterium]
MKIKARLSAIFLLLTLCSGVSLAHEAHCKDTPLGATMADMKKPYKALRKAVREGDEASYQQLANELLTQSKEARDQRPLLVSEKQRKMANYQKEMDKLISLLEQLSQSPAESAQGLLDQIQQLRKQGHKKFRKDCD